jgi:general secretion pathway protein A
MYESFFGLRESAFALTPDPRFLWLSGTHEEGLAALFYGITRRKGFILLTGEVGAGKTTLLRAALDQIPAETESALVMNTAGLEPLDLLKLIAVEFRISGEFHSKVDYIIALNEFLLERLEAGLNTVLIIDEAQNLGPVLLEEVRLLSNLETDTEKLLQIVLTGQPALRRHQASPELRQLRQRIEVAGGRYEKVFAPGSEPTFYAFSEGCPRLVSLLADRVLLSAYGRQLRPVPPSLVESKAKEMDAARTEGAAEQEELED